MAKGKDEKIPNGKTPWEGYAGSRVEEYIKEALAGKVGYFHRPQDKGSDNNYHLYGFASESDFNEWNSDPDNNAHLLLTDVALPASGGGSTTASYIVNLYSDSPQTIVTTDNTVKINIRFTSEEFNPITQTTQSTTEGGTLTVQTRLNSQSAWVTRGTIENIPSIPATSTNEWWPIDITNMLNTGSQQVRLIVKGDTTGQNTRYLQFTVTKTTLGLTFATQWERPITDGIMRLSYYVSGAVSKTLHIKIDGQREIERNIGTSVYTETPIQVDVTDAVTDTVKVLTHGIHEIEAWISVNDSTIQSEHITSQVMVVADTTDTTPRLILNDIKSKLTNWTAEQILTYAVYNPSGEATPLKFILENYTGDKQYMTLDVGNVPSQVKQTLNNVIEIDSEDTTINAYMRFMSGNTAIHPVLGFEVDNTENFSPTSNPDFILNPRSRTNDETNPQTIINAANGQVIASTWKGFGLKADGWLEDSNNQRCLRVLAGRTIDIELETLKDFIGTNNHSSLTVELDIATRNAIKTDVPVLRMCSYRDDNGPQGFELRPWQAVFMTRDKREREDQDVMIGEGRRTHIALNIIYGINGTSQNYVRIFVNGKINREFEWSPEDEFVQYVNGVRTSQGIRIGSEYCDIDIYGIRLYNRSLSATDIRQDYMASLPTVAEKIKFREDNDILGDSNLISYAKTREKYNTIVITGQVPSFSTGNIKTKCDWEIHVVGDPEHSGTLNNVTTSGQGTSSRSYWKWNLQAKPNDDTDWIDELGNHHGAGYQLDDTVPFATKLVAKLNWASSQQSHKLGSCNLYTDLWRRCTGGSSITNTAGFENCRVSVKQKPFFLFVRPTADAEPVFYGLYTFGPGKGDKPTFGYDKKKFPNYLMIEGCDNGEPLTNHRIPWNEDITIGGDEDELIQYNGRKQWEIDMGNADSLSYFKDAFNFVYLCTPHIEPFSGTLAQLQATTEADVNRQTLYWVTQASGSSSAKYDLYRYDELTSQWVDAGVAKISAGKYAKLNLATQLGITPTGNVWADINQQFINARILKFSREASQYFKMNDAFFHQMFCKLIGASDNRAKNTYLYLATHDGSLKIHFAQDDLDTIFLTDNVGRKNKPYYVEEHDRDADGGTYWNGEANAMYDLFELAFPTELRAMMKSILGEMANLATDKTLMGCMEDYYFHVQRYFPAVAYNETARLLYEEASAKWVTGDYIASTHPITQSLGDQLEGEMQWVKLRLIYLSSFASYGAFTMNGEGSLTFRSATTTTGAAPNYSFALTPHMWIYPAVSAGSSTMFGRGKAHPQRVKAGETYILDGVAADNDTNIQVHGIHYYTSVGEFGDKSLSGTFTVSGERLVEFHASKLPMEFRPTAVEVTAPNLRVFDIKGASTVTGSINFTLQTRLEEVDMRGTSISSFLIPEPTGITSLMLPATLTRLQLTDYSKLESDNFELEGVASIQSFEFANCPNLSSQTIVSTICATPNNNLSECKVNNIYWRRFALEYLMKLASINADLSGKIELDDSATPTFDEKIALLDAFGNIDSETNKLNITYKKVYLTSMEITGDTYFSQPGTYQLQITPNSPRANDFTKIEWSISKNSCNATINAVTGELTLPKVGTEAEKPEATVTCKATLSDGSTLTATATLGFYFRKCRVGDLVFHDGTYSDKPNKNKVAIGVCFYIDPKDETRRLMVSTQELSTGIQWGLYFNNGSGSWAEGGSDDLNYNMRDITLADSPGYNVYDTPIANIGSHGMQTNYVTDANYRDEYTDDGFKEFADMVGAGDIGFMRLPRDYTFRGHTYETGTYLPRGFYKTLQIIQHRNTVLQDSDVALPLPQASADETELECLNRLMSDIVLTHNNASKWRQFYYPAASMCHAFQPTVKAGMTLNDKFKSGMWFLGAIGDYYRCYWYHKERNVENSQFAIFQKWVELGLFNAWRATWYWSSTEYSRGSAWYVGFHDGGTNNTGKCYSGSVRAVAAF